jgi:uncharacterized membrane protein YqaE (UPF0057 family)
MRFVIAFFVPPLAIFLCGMLTKSVLNLLLCCTLFGIPIAVIWAMFEVANHKAEKRNRALIRAVGR